VDNGRDADVGLGLPCDGVGIVGAQIAEDAGRWAGYGLVEVCVGGDGRALIVVKDGEGFETLFEINIVGRDNHVRLDAGGNCGGIGRGHLGLGLVGSAAKHLLEAEGSSAATDGEDEASGKGVEEDGRAMAWSRIMSRCSLTADLRKSAKREGQK